ncbi:hypothetical protein QJS10_CPB18g01162 [Acorus calamus]|uniref:Uncharacterized protein n=1 Tax=Acorus calamus TaxID=4465 RepID=A0AAV9CPI8_ACOCL|nr:hypothetical protein QJS10_CPB18g01162 [Acorus calamus]
MASTDMNLALLSGEAEKEYWSRLCGNQEKHWEFKGNRGRGRNNGGRRHFNAKRPRCN